MFQGEAFVVTLTLVSAVYVSGRYPPRPYPFPPPTAPPVTTTQPPEFANFQCTKDGHYGVGCNNKYVSCSGGVKYIGMCPATTLRFDQKSSSCQLPKYVDECGGTSTTTLKPPTGGGGGGGGGYGSSTYLPVVSCVGREPGIITDLAGLSCSRYIFWCMGGDVAEVQLCPANTYYDPPTNVCDFKEYVNSCGGNRDLKTTAAQPLFTTTTGPPVDFDCSGKAEGSYPDPRHRCSHRYYHCSSAGGASKFYCDYGEAYHPYRRECLPVGDLPYCRGGAYVGTTTPSQLTTTTLGYGGYGPYHHYYTTTTATTTTTAQLTTTTQGYGAYGRYYYYHPTTTTAQVTTTTHGYGGYYYYYHPTTTTTATTTAQITTTTLGYGGYGYYHFYPTTTTTTAQITTTTPGYGGYRGYYYHYPTTSTSTTTTAQLTTTTPGYGGYYYYYHPTTTTTAQVTTTTAGYGGYGRYYYHHYTTTTTSTTTTAQITTTTAGYGGYYYYHPYSTTTAQITTTTTSSHVPCQGKKPGNYPKFHCSPIYTYCGSDGQAYDLTCPLSGNLPLLYDETTKRCRPISEMLYCIPYLRP